MTARSSAAAACGSSRWPTSTATRVWMNRARRVSASSSPPGPAPGPPPAPASPPAPRPRPTPGSVLRSKGLSRTPPAPSARCAPPTAWARCLGNPHRQNVVAVTRGLCGDAQVIEEGLHPEAEGFVMLVGAGPGRGLAALFGDADTGQEGADDLVAQHQQGGDGAQRLGWGVVAP